MKNRRNIIIAFLLCATLIVGVGYAAFVGNLTINGTTAFNPENNTLDENIEFSAVQYAENCTVNIGETGDIATMDVVFTFADALKNDEGEWIATAKCILVIANNSENTAVTLTNPTDFHNTNSFFKITTNWNQDVVLNGGKNTTIEITVTANVGGDNIPKQEGTFIIQIPVSPVTTSAPSGDAT